jgi:hypothetical protein
MGNVDPDASSEVSTHFGGTTKIRPIMGGTSSQGQLEPSSLATSFSDTTLSVNEPDSCFLALRIRDLVADTPQTSSIKYGSEFTYIRVRVSERSPSFLNENAPVNLVGRV